MLKIQSRWKTKNVLIALAIIVGVAGIGLALWQMRWIFEKPGVVTNQKPETKPSPTVARAESKMLVMGDVYWGRYVNDWSTASTLKYAYPFQKLSEFNRDEYNAWIADMECPITDNPKVSSAVEDSTLQFDCSPDYLPEAKKWFTAFTLANNHTDNQGAAGYVETKQHLEENGIQYFGGYNPEDYDNLCNILSIPASVTMSDGSTKEGKLPIVWCGYHGVFKTPSEASIRVMSKYSSLFNIVAMPHSGAEYKAAPDEIKTTLYRGLIDGGADVVLGDHAHWVQSTEAYKGKLIVYSLGNFIFDQQFSTEVTRSAVINMNVSVAAETAPDIAKWLELGVMCASYTDDCLQKATEQKLVKLPLKYHFAAFGSRNDGKVTHRASDVELASVKQRLDWQKTVQGLSGANSGE